VVLITALGDIKSAVQAMKLGALDYVTKPPDPDELKLTVERAIEHGRLRRENESLRAELRAGGRYGEHLVGRSAGMLKVFETVNKVARTDSTVLITGETGTGKELVAQAIHYRSPRAGKPLVAFNCASLNPNLVESELFGHEKGAFTGAAAMRRGRFEEADGGTLFLDEIAETTTEFQAKLLRALQEKEIRRVGGGETVPVDVRLVASTNRDLEKEVAGGRFREDLFFRLQVIPIHMPPLRERVEDIPLLADHFLALYSEQYGARTVRMSGDCHAYLQAREWKGNVRELQHVIERAVVLAEGEVITPADLSGPRSDDTQGEITLQAFLDRQSREYLVRVLDSTGWHKQQAADLLGIDRVTLYRMLKKFRLEGEK
jgi:DNA-binding NtrC family response regulator